MRPITFRNGPITLAGHLHLPADFDANGSYPALVVVHPGGGVKEQTAGLYAAKMAAEGFVALAFDAAYQGESGGEPRQFEDPHQRAEDARAAVDHLTTLKFVDRARIAALGVCAGGGYALDAATSDPRLKAVGTVSGLCVGSMFRRGWDGSGDPASALALRAMGAERRTAEANGEAVASLPLAPEKDDPALPADLRDAYAYYHTPRAAHPNAPGVTPVRSLTRLVAYDALHMADLLLTQPLLLIAGSEAGSMWHSARALEVAASTEKRLYVVKGANHMDLYDGPAFVAEAVAELTRFYRAVL